MIFRVSSFSLFGFFLARGAVRGFFNLLSFKFYVFCFPWALFQALELSFWPFKISYQNYNIEDSFRLKYKIRTLKKYA
jgi:hypothetical protein